MNNDLRNLSSRVKREADRLLKRTGVLATLDEYGEVHIRGIYELDLMVDGDIDIYVIAREFRKETALAMLNELIGQDHFRGYFFYDFTKRRKAGFPKGFYIGLKTRVGERKWKIDIWLLKKMDGVSDRFMRKIKAGMDEAKRERILKLKKEAKDRGLEIPSHRIYEAVAGKGARGLKDI